MSAPETKHYVKVYEVDKPTKVSKEISTRLKGAVSGKMMSKMRKEAIFCPVLNRERPFLECFVCSNFIRRFKGEVHCAGLPLPVQEA